MAGSNTVEDAKGNGWVWLILMLISGVFFAFFQNFHVSKDFTPLRFDMLSERDNPALAKTPELLAKEKFAKNGYETRVLWLEGAGKPIPFRIEFPETLRGKVKAFFPKLNSKPMLKVYANGVQSDVITPDWDGSVSIIEFNMPASLLASGENTLTLKAEGAENLRVGYDSIALKNFVGISKRFPKALVVFDGNYALPKKIKKPFSFILYPSLMFLLWLISGNLLHYIKGTPLDNAFKRVFLWHMPVITGFLGSAVFSYFSNYIILYDPKSFTILALLPSSIIIAYSFFKISLRAVPALWRKASLNSIVDMIMGIKLPVKKIGGGLFSFKSAVRHASTLAVLAFIVCLSSAGFLLIVKRQVVAERMADIAYFSLVFGVLLRIFDVRKEEE